MDKDVLPRTGDVCYQVRNLLHEHTHCQYQDSTPILQIVKAMSTWQANVRDCVADSRDDPASNTFIQDMTTSLPYSKLHTRLLQSRYIFR